MRLFGVRKLSPLCVSLCLLVPMYVGAEAPDALDAVPRVLRPGQALPCRDLPLVSYAGTTLRYGRSLRVHRDFAPRLRAFEEIVTEVFDFGPAPRDVSLPAGLHRSLRRAFSVRVQGHWKARRGVGRRHAAFLQALTRALIARQDVFSVVLGPGWPGHHNHLHLDAAPYRVVEVTFTEAGGAAP